MEAKIPLAHYRVFLPDLNFYQQTVACQFACPVRTDGRAYVTAIARGEYERAYLIARETNPFASTCGWVCGAPGEQLDGVLRAVDFLINVNLGGYNLDLGKRVLVIGGGNVAMDVARTAARLGPPAQSGRG